MTGIPHTTVYILGLDPLNNLTPMDGLIRALRRLNWPLTIVGVSTNSHHSGNVLSEMFDQVLILKNSGPDRFAELAQLTASVHGQKVLIPTNQDDALAVAQYRFGFSEKGLCCPGPSPAQAAKSDADTISYLAEQGIDTVNWQQFDSMNELLTASVNFAYPIKMTTLDGSKRWIIYEPMSLRVLADRVFRQKKSIRLRHLGLETVYQASTIVGTHWKPGGWAMVREIAPARTSEPWMFLSVESPLLQETASRVAMTMEYQGPITMRFVYSKAETRYLLDSFAPIFPVWTDLAAHCGVNLPGRLLEGCLGYPVTTSPFTAISGYMLTFNSFDVSLPSDTWLNLAGRGGF